MRFHQTLGWMPFNPDASTTVNASLSFTNSANYRAAWGWIQEETKTLSTFTFRNNALTGTSTHKLEIWAESTTGLPDSTTVLDTSTTTAVAVAANSYVTFTGFTVTLTAGVRYFAVLTNTHATPASNFIGALNGYAYSNPGGWAGRMYSGDIFTMSTNSGSTWSMSDTGSNPGVPIFQLGFSDSTVYGLLYSNFAVDTTNIVYAGRMVGTKFTSPASAFNVKAVSMCFSKSGTPAQNAVFKIYNNTTLLGTSEPIKKTVVTTSAQLLNAIFATPIVLPASSPIRVVLAEVANADTSSNYYAMRKYTWNTAALSLDELPFDNMAGTYFDGTSWTDTPADVRPFTLMLKHQDIVVPPTPQGVGLNQGIQSIGGGICA